MMKITFLISWTVFIFASIGCKSITEKNSSPHKQYEAKIITAGLDKTSLGRSWLLASDESLRKPLSITIPYAENGYFPVDKAVAVAYRFKCKRGEKIIVRIDGRPKSTFRLFADFFKAPSSTEQAEWLAAVDTINNLLEYEIEKSGDYLLRIQPELLEACEYNINISSGPSLAFPVRNGRIESVWGDPRDAGGRRHEGVDIFAAKYSPVLAAANGIVRVGENRLGGNVVWQNVADKNYILYYAHLDKQLVSDGEEVNIGDTIGLVGNTGNARTTPAHLHFGIYATGGAIDPFPFVNPVIKTPPPITTSNLVGKTVRTRATAKFFQDSINGSTSIALKGGSVVDVSCAISGWYRVITPDRTVGYIRPDEITTIDKPLKVFRLKFPQSLYDTPDTSAARKKIIAEGEDVQLLASFKQFNFVKDKTNQQGWMLGR
jgi:murein DD-endopeptidase MepM/ murein hydrolase activator NlpD